MRTTLYRVELNHPDNGRSLIDVTTDLEAAIEKTVCKTPVPSDTVPDRMYADVIQFVVDGHIETLEKCDLTDPALFAKGDIVGTFRYVS